MYPLSTGLAAARARAAREALGRRRRPRARKEMARKVAGADTGQVQDQR